MNKALARSTRDKVLEAIKTLHSIVETDDDWDSSNLKNLKRGVGMTIGRLEIELLAPIYKEYPELDDIPYLR